MSFNREGPRGPRGEKGARGEQGDTGAAGRDSGYSYQSVTVTGPATFLGMAKSQVIMLLVAIMMVSYAIIGIEVWQIQALSHSNTQQIVLNKVQTAEALQARHALCGIREFDSRAIEEAKAYLRLTPTQRVLKYGPVLGRVPESYVRAQLVAQEQQLSTLAVLTCP